MMDRAGPKNPTSLSPTRVKHVERLTKWEEVPPDGITFRDAVYRGQAVQLLGEERYRFMGAESAGCIVEIIALRKPVSFSARVGFFLRPDWSIRSKKQERELFEEIERDYRSK